MARIIQGTIVFRQATYAEFTSTNRLLLEGEPAYEVDTKRLKIGDGVTLYNDLDYFESGNVDDTGYLALIANHIGSIDPHPAYDDGASLVLLYENKKV